MTEESEPGPSTPKKTSSDIYNDTSSISCKRSVCDPLKLKMTPKVNNLGVTMTPENFFEGKTLLHLILGSDRQIALCKLLTVGQVIMFAITSHQ